MYVGRLTPSKRVTEIVQAFAMFYRRTGRGRLVLIGNGARGYEARLERLARQLGVSERTEFAGWLGSAKKQRRLAQARALLMASAREGWGLVVTECNACGTPAIVYDVPGLRDSVRHMETGLVVTPSPTSMAEAMLKLEDDPELYQRLQSEAERWAKTFTYEVGARMVRESLSMSVAT